VIGCPIESVKIGMDVQVVFEGTGEGIFIPQFRLQ